MKRLLPILLIIVTPLFAASQATTIIISEFAEGSSNNKYIELYNGTANPVDLSFFSLSSCNNGCDVFGEFDFPNNITFAPGTILPSGGTYVIAHGSSDPIILAVADQTFNFLSNGDDVYALTLAGATANNYTIIDILGDLQGDPGTNWAVAGVSPGTQNNTMVRKPNICVGNPNELASFGVDSLSSEWWVFPSNYWDSLDMHTDNCVSAGCNTFGSTTQIACGSYTGPSGTVFTSTGLFTDTILNAASCDSIIAIDLTINPIYNIVTSDSACAGVSYSFGTQTLTTTGNYTELFTSINGCDSTVNLDMIFLVSYTTNVSASICNGDSYILGAQTLTASGSYSELFTAAGGCDSTVNLTLTVIPNSTATISPIVCGSYTSPSGNYTWVTSNTYTDTITNTAGCDSVITIILTVNTSTANTLNEVACDSYTLNTTTYTSSGVYTQVLTNAAGCDSTITLNLEITPTPNSPTVTGDSSYCVGDVMIAMTSTSTSFDSLIISGVADATLPGGLPKCVEFYALYDIPDLSIYGFGSANNGGGTDGVEYTFPAIPLTAGSYYRVATDSVNFMTFYGIFPNDLNSAANVNGDDAIELFKDSVVIDVFGDINIDGSGQPWEYLDGWAYRNNNTLPNGGVWDIAGWSFSGPNALDGASDNASSGNPFPIGTYQSTPPTSSITWYTDAALSIVFGTGSPIAPAASSQTYYATETLTGGSSCESTGSPVIISLNALPTINGGLDQTVCEGVTVTLSGAGGNNYVWSNSVNDGISFIPPVGSNTYTVTGTDVNGCSNTDQVIINVNALPTVTFGALTDMCVYNNAITLSQGSPAGGTYSGNGVTGTLFDPTAAGNGTHTLVYSFTDGNGCTASDSAFIFVDACASISEITNSSIRVYPNPTKSLLTVSFDGSMADISVKDINGKTLVSKLINANETLDLTSLSAGTYFIEVSIEGEKYIKRIIVE